MKKIFLLVVIYFLSNTTNAQINISTAIGAGTGAFDPNWQVRNTSSALQNSYIVGNLAPGTWENPVPATGANWIASSANAYAPSPEDYFYERKIIVPANTKKLKWDFKVAADDVMKSVEIVRPNNTAILQSLSASNNYKFSKQIVDSIICPEPGTWIIRAKTFIADKAPSGPGAFMLSGFVYLTDGNCSDTPVPSTTCCPGKNLICNGGFEEPKPCFESQYQQKQNGIFKPGQYAIINFQEATGLCKQWNYFNQASCQKTGKGMFVNGVTNGTGKKVIWQQQVNFNGWAQYRFCADVIPLVQCCFNVVPKLEIKLTYQSGGQTKTVLLNQTSPENCAIKYSQAVAQWEGSDGGTANLSITLDETGIGDGNDFVLDNIAFVELQPIAKAITNSASVSQSGGLLFNGNFSGTLPAGASCGWFITPLDANGQPDPNCPVAPLQWWSANTNFQGFVGCGLSGNAPGKLLPGKSYRITFATAGTCYAWDAAQFTIKVDPASMKMIITKDEKADISKDPVLKTLKTDMKKEVKSIIKGD